MSHFQSTVPLSNPFFSQRLCGRPQAGEPVGFPQSGFLDCIFTGQFSKLLCLLYCLQPGSLTHSLDPSQIWSLWYRWWCKTGGKPCFLAAQCLHLYLMSCKKKKVLSVLFIHWNTLIKEMLFIYYLLPSRTVHMEKKRINAWCFPFFKKTIFKTMNWLSSLPKLTNYLFYYEFKDLHIFDGRRQVVLL